MKLNLYPLFLLILIGLMLVFGLFGCASKKESIFKQKEKTEITNDSVIKTEVSKAIDDKLNITVPKSNTNDKYKDSIINSKVDQILSNLNTSKQSGNNSYSLYYNLEKRLLELQATIGETKNESSNVKSEETNETDTESETTKIIKRIPWWIWVIAFFLLLPNIIKVVALIINPISLILKNNGK